MKLSVDPLCALLLLALLFRLRKGAAPPPIPSPWALVAGAPPVADRPSPPPAVVEQAKPTAAAAPSPPAPPPVRHERGLSPICAVMLKQEGKWIRTGHVVRWGSRDATTVLADSARSLQLPDGSIHDVVNR